MDWSEKYYQSEQRYLDKLEREALLALATYQGPTRYMLGRQNGKTEFANRLLQQLRDRTIANNNIVRYTYHDVFHTLSVMNTLNKKEEEPRMFTDRSMAACEAISTFKRIIGEKPKTKVQTITGLKENDLFRVKGYNNLYRFLAGDRVKARPAYNATWIDGDYVLSLIVNDPSLIQRQPSYSEEQIKALKWLRDGGFRYVCGDKDGVLYAYSDLPKNNGSLGEEWLFNDAQMKSGVSWIGGGFVKCLAPLMDRDWKIPLSVVKELTTIEYLELDI